MKVVSTKGKKKPPLLVASVGIRLETESLMALTRILAAGAIIKPIVITISDINTNAVFFFIALPFSLLMLASFDEEKSI